MEFTSKINNIIDRKYFILQALLDQYRLYKRKDPLLKSFLHVFNSVKKKNISQVEDEWFKRIEKKREELNSSTVPILYTDYGAGSSEQNLTQQQMYEGRTLETTIGKMSKASKPANWGLLLFKLIREFRPMTCLELGTCVGISASYQTAALELNNKGILLTLEGSDSLAEIARKTFNKLGLERSTVISGRFQDTLKDAIDKSANIDFVFIDGHHDEQATIKYFNEILPCLSNRAILVFDDISWSKGMRRAWNMILKNNDIRLSFNLYALGICFYNPSLQGMKKSFKIYF